MRGWPRPASHDAGTLIMVTATRWRVLAGAAPAGIVTALAWVIALRRPIGVATSALQQVVQLLPWLLVPAGCLLIGIGFIANRRFLSDDAIDGGVVDDYAGTIGARYLQNTLEQAVLAVLIWLALAAIEPARAAVLVPMLATLFGIGRLAFWIGYLLAPWARAFGFGLTFYPSAVALIWLILRIIA